MCRESNSNCFLYYCADYRIPRSEIRSHLRVLFTRPSKVRNRLRTLSCILNTPEIIEVLGAANKLRFDKADTRMSPYSLYHSDNRLRNPSSTLKDTAVFPEEVRPLCEEESKGIINTLSAQNVINKHEVSDELPNELIEMPSVPAFSIRRNTNYLNFRDFSSIPDENEKTRFLIDMNSDDACISVDRINNESESHQEDFKLEKESLDDAEKLQHMDPSVRKLLNDLKKYISPPLYLIISSQKVLQK